MEVVQELRALSASAGKNLSTQTGIFSSHFASEHLLRDVVKDSTIDIMHVFFCGMTRYLLSWLLDLLIPRDFTWEQLNAAKNAFPWGAGIRVPPLERSKVLPSPNPNPNPNPNPPL
jgi:hypothetical protein